MDDIREGLEKLLDVYSFNDILEDNDMEEIDVLEILFRQGFLKLPDWRPL